MTVVAGDILRTTANFLLGDGTQYQNVYHHRRIGLGVITDATHVAAIAAWAETMYGELESVVTTTVVETLSSVDRVAWVVDAWEVVENIGTFLIAFAPTGTALLAMPNQVSAFVTFKTARPKTVGRKFLFPLGEAAFESGLLTAGAVAAVVAYADDAVNNIEVSFPLDLLLPGVPRTGVDSFEDFTVALVTNLVGTQRRRRRGYGA